MKKLLILIFATIFALSAFTGCSPTKPSAEANPDSDAAPTPSEPPRQGITVNKISFETLDFDNLPEDSKKLIEKFKIVKGYTYWQEDEYYVVAIFAGEKPTAGYAINVKFVEDNEGRAVIVIEETKPTDMAAAVISYPFTVIKAKGITNNFNVSDIEGSVFNPIPGANISKINEDVSDDMGTYVGRIDTNSVEIKLESGEIKAFIITEVLDTFETLKENSKINFIYYENKYGQLIITDIDVIE